VVQKNLAYPHTWQQRDRHLADVAAFEREATRKSWRQARSRFNDESASTQRGRSCNIRVLPDGNPMLVAKWRRFATGRAIFRGYHLAIR
jgi:hypothetical protein